MFKGSKYYFTTFFYIYIHTNNNTYNIFNIHFLSLFRLILNCKNSTFYVTYIWIFRKKYIYL